MTGRTGDRSARAGSPWRVAAWTVAALVLLLPLVAMQFTDDVRWDLADFVFAAVLLAGVGLPLELAVRTTGNVAYRTAVGVALGAAFLLTWINAAVGLIGSENNPANRMYWGVLGLAVIGSFLARFRPRGMARVLIATASAQATVAVIAIAAGLGHPESGPWELLLVNGLFVALFVGSALLFRRAAATEAGPQ